MHSSLLLDINVKKIQMNCRLPFLSTQTDCFDKRCQWLYRWPVYWSGCWAFEQTSV